MVSPICLKSRIWGLHNTHILAFRVGTQCTGRVHAIARKHEAMKLTDGDGEGSGTALLPVDGGGPVLDRPALTVCMNRHMVHSP